MAECETGLQKVGSGVQKSKIHRHTIATGKFAAPTQRFQHIHIDIVGPLLTSHGKKYCITVVDQFTLWPKAYPVATITAETVAKQLVRQWIARFGAPARIITDQGRQFRTIQAVNSIDRNATSENHSIPPSS